MNICIIVSLYPILATVSKNCLYEPTTVIGLDSKLKRVYVHVCKEVLSINTMNLLLFDVSCL